MIYLYSKSLEVTGALHPLSTDAEKKQFDKQQLGGTLQPDKFLWCQIKPFMLSKAWYENDNVILNMLDGNRNGFKSMPVGVGLFPEENRLFWQMQATKQLLRYLDYRQNRDTEKMIQAREGFKLALNYRRTQRGLINLFSCPSFFNHAVEAILNIIDIVEALRSARHKNMRLIETCVRKYLNAVSECIPKEQFIDPTVNEILTLMRLELYEQTAVFYQEAGSDVIQCRHDKERLHFMLAAFASSKALEQLNRIERIVPNLRADIESLVNESIQKTLGTTAQ